ncbi:hypothetical protein DXG01_001520 [Tephrocybe rancida]|nr:hypothetical protein DXG01_001520 [Tephrocybe rancida]
MHLTIRENSDRDDASRYYSVVDGAVVPFADVEAAHPDFGPTAIDPTDFTRMRFVIILQTDDGYPRRLRLLQWNDLNADHWRAMSKSKSADLHEGWFEALLFFTEKVTPADVESTFGRHEAS